jgi:4-hydroxy-3-polyprenylbenzoate decarboxylase
MRDCANDLERNGQLKRVSIEVDPNLEMAEIHRRVFEAKGPALLFEKVKGSPFQAISNIYGTAERTDFIFRGTLGKTNKVIDIKADPTNFLKNPLKYLSAPFTAIKALPMKARFSAPIKYGETTIDKLPQLISWPMDGGGFVTLPQVMTLPPGSKNIMESNLGMYRIQLTGNEYENNKEIGLHYQIHRGIGVHHTMYNETEDDFHASVFVGGLPSHAFAAIMPMPEGLSELTFAGMLGGRRFRYLYDGGNVLSADADFCITGVVRKNEKKPEGPFGDHLGYYSLQHDFPVMDVKKVYHRKDPLWHFTVVGRPPQEDSYFGYLIHKLVKPLTSQEFPGIKEIHAVDAAGVHPLLLAIGSERYMPFRDKKPEEVLTQANRIIGSGQTSLAKFLIISNHADNPDLHCHDIADFFSHVLERVDWTRDLHFHTKTTMDTLDYSGSGWNAGSKVVIAAVGEKRRTLAARIPDSLQLPAGFSTPTIAQKGVLAIEAPTYNKDNLENEIKAIGDALTAINPEQYPLVVLTDDSEFLAATLNNFLWATFTRADPAADIHGVNSFSENKHWGCQGSLIIDARIKPHHAPPLVENEEIKNKVDLMLADGGALSYLLK